MTDFILTLKTLHEELIAGYEAPGSDYQVVSADEHVDTDHSPKSGEFDFLGMIYVNDSNDDDSFRVSYHSKFEADGTVDSYGLIMTGCDFGGASEKAVKLVEQRYKKALLEHLCNTGLIEHTDDISKAVYSYCKSEKEEGDVFPVEMAFYYMTECGKEHEVVIDYDLILEFLTSEQKISLGVNGESL